MRSDKPTILAWIADITLIVIFSLIYYLIKPIQTERVIYIPQGSIYKIITHLEQRGYSVWTLDAFLLRLLGSPQSGWIDMKTYSTTKADFLYKLTTAKAALQDVTLIPGETTYVFMQQLAQATGLDAHKLYSAFLRYAPMKEGVLVPNTYRVPLGLDEESLVRLLLHISHKRMVALSMKIFGKYDEKKWFRYLVIASIIQKESANKKEMPIVASVIYNRLKKGMKLQMDGTLNYGRYSHEKIASKRIRQDHSSFNTYLHKGVPKIPICNVGIDAIRAAIFPAKTDYLYFMRSKKGTHNFTCNYSTHLKNIRNATK